MTDVNKNENYFGAIDLGSRNCRLLIVAQNGNSLRKVTTLSRTVDLGEGVTRTNRLSKKSMNRAVVALEQCIKKISQYNPMTYTSVATEACRRAANQVQFLKIVERKVGIKLRVISYAEEARYALLGCRTVIHPDTQFALIFDIGGGSTELLWASLEDGLPTQLIGCVSIPYGVVSLSEAFKSDILHNYNATLETVKKIAHHFCMTHNIHEIAASKKVQLIATSGITTTLAALKQNLRFYNRDKIDGTLLTYDETQDIIKSIQLMLPEERALHPCIGLHKDDLLLSGLAILEGLYHAWPELSLTVTDHGVRDGIVYELAFRDQAKVA